MAGFDYWAAAVVVPRSGLCEGFYLMPGSHVAVGNFYNSLFGTIYHVSEGTWSIYFIEKTLKNQKTDPLMDQQGSVPCSVLAEMPFPPFLLCWSCWDWGRVNVTSVAGPHNNANRRICSLIHILSVNSEEANKQTKKQSIICCKIAYIDRTPPPRCSLCCFS